MSTTIVATVRRDCLVVHISTDTELERALRYGYYRIPERVLGRALGRDALEEADLLAFYQGARMRHGLCGAIEFVAPIHGRDCQLRRELIPDEPLHPRADDGYVVLRLGRRRRLPRPIVSARPRRFTFLRTTRRRLRTATTLNDLIIGTHDEESLWQRMKSSAGVVREAEKERRWLVKAGGMLMEVEVALFHGDGRVAIVRDRAKGAKIEQAGWRIVSFSPTSTEEDVLALVEELLLGDPL